MLWPLAYAGSDNDDDNDNKSDKSNDDNEEEAKDPARGREGSTPEPGEGDPRPKTNKQPGVQQLKQTRQDRNAEYEARIAELPLRSEPIGLDRYHRKYWLLTGMSALLVISSTFYVSGLLLP